MRFTRLTAVLLCAVLTAGCQSWWNGGTNGRTTEAAGKSGTGELRTDLEPLTKRFAALGTPEQARWMSGTFGSDRAPGPSTYWIDAVITLPKNEVDELRSAYGPESAGETPDVVDGLRGELPSGSFLTGERLDRAFAADRWFAKVYLVPDERALVLVATGS
ncbi:hypothetical protein [Lentzea jiangxiensis]|uniref:Lipoprotein n=1 Tax=Lentzea jiangxiensis TaxID=641025 RepID=A0A1H0JZ95_9PSEU|nr:hypothetical protein [Lentzea jiangxiensis]SDO48731.1 hypothetical protein SAMN05421507_102689 [Lentzea jiangxiensis]